MTLIEHNGVHLEKTLSNFVFAIGPWQQGEFAVLRSQILGSDSWLFIPECETASEMISHEDRVPELILIAQLLPGSYCQEDIEHLRRLAPLAQILVVAGTWCEGELRTGKPPAGVMRLYWYELASWWETARHACNWSQGLDGVLSPRSRYAELESGRVDSVAIHTRALAVFETIRALLATHGAESIWCRGLAELPRQVSIGIWDGGQLDEKEFDQLRDFNDAVRQRDGSTVVLLDFPRKQHYQQLSEIGCKVILAKPYIIEELKAACCCSPIG